MKYLSSTEVSYHDRINSVISQGKNQVMESRMEEFQVSVKYTLCFYT